MTFLPIVLRELRVQARRKGNHWSRWGVALVAVLMSVFVLLMYSRFSDPATAGAYAYNFLLVVACVVAGSAALFTADALSVERREGTLGFLFLTDLGGHDVVLGKLASHGLVVLYALLAILPAVALPILAGGVTLGQVSREALACLNVLFVALTLGIWISTKPQTQFVAMRRTASIFIGLLLVPLLGAHWLPALISSKYPVAMLSPMECLRLSANAAFAVTAASFWTALLVSHLVGWCFLWLAVWCIRRNWREPGLEWHWKAGATVSPASGGEIVRATPPRRLLGVVDPVDWRASQLPGQRALLWAAALAGGMGSFWWMLASFAGMQPLMSGGFINGFSFAITTSSSVLFSWAASRFFLEARRSGELELLLCTPVGARQIISGQWAAFWRHLRWPLALLVFSSMLPTLAHSSFPQFGFRGIGFTASLVLGSVLHLANLILGVLALSWMGMWFGLHARGPLGAVTRTVLWVKGLPWIVSTLCSIAFALAGMWLGGMGGTPPLGYMFIYLSLPVLTLLAYVLFIRWAKRRLQQELTGGGGLNPPRQWRERRDAWRAAIRRARHWTPS